MTTRAAEATPIFSNYGRAYQNKLAAIVLNRRTFAVQDRAELSMPPAPNAKFVAA